MKHEEVSELLGAFALDAVDGDEYEQIEAHLAECPRCRGGSRRTSRSGGCIGQLGRAPSRRPVGQHRQPTAAAARRGSSTHATPRARCSRRGGRRIAQIQVAPIAGVPPVVTVIGVVGVIRVIGIIGVAKFVTHVTLPADPTGHRGLRRSCSRGCGDSARRESCARQSSDLTAPTSGGSERTHGSCSCAHDARTQSGECRDSRTQSGGPVRCRPERTGLSGEIQFAHVVIQ